MDSIPPSRPPEPPPTLASEGSDDRRRSLRKRIHEQASLNSPDGTPLAKRKTTRTRLTFHEPILKNNRMYINACCLNYPKLHRLDMEPLIARNFALKHIPDVFTDTSDVAGIGVFADRDYDKHEIVGFYRGQLMKHSPVPPDIIAHYCQEESIDPENLPELVLVTWVDQPDKPSEFITLSDSHTLWSGITVYGDEDENIELGINGLSNGNDLAFLNHIRPGNVRPIPTVCQSASFISPKQQLHARKGAYNDSDLWIPVVTTEKVRAGDELGFDYDKESDDIRFSLVGYDIFKKPRQYFRVKDDHVWRVSDLPTPVMESDTSSEDLNSFDCSIPDFRSTLSEDEEDFIERWLNRDPQAHKVINERIRAQDERAAQLVIFLAGHEQGLRVYEVSWHLSKLGFRFESDRPRFIEAYRDYVCQNFQKQEAARILQVASIDPVELIEMGGSRTKRESHALLANISEDTLEARQYLDAYLKRAFYAASREKRTDCRAIYTGITAVLKMKPKILGNPGNLFSSGHVYRYMVDRKLFAPEDIIRYMPIVHLRECLASGNQEDIDRGAKDLDHYAEQWIKDNKNLGRLVSHLKFNSVPNLLESDAHWSRHHLKQLPSVKSMLPDQAGTDLSTIVKHWLEGNSQSDLDIRQYLMTKTTEAMGEIGKILRHDHDWALTDVVNRLVLMKIKGLEITIPTLRDAIYDQSSDKSILELSNLLEGAVHAFYQKARIFHKKHGSYESRDGVKLDDMFSEDDWKRLKEEFKSKCKTNFYPKFWTTLLKECPSPGLHKLYMTVVLQTKIPGQVRDQLSEKKIPRFPEKDDEWTASLLMKNLYDNEVFDVICPNDNHIAVLIASKIDMTDKTVNGKDFNDFLEEELRRREYASTTFGGLKRMKYPAALATKAKFKGKHSSSFNYTRKKK